MVLTDLDLFLMRPPRALIGTRGRAAYSSYPEEAHVS